MIEYIVHDNYENVAREIRRRMQEYNKKGNSYLSDFFPVFHSLHSCSIPIYNLFPELLNDTYQVSDDLDMSRGYYNITVIPYHNNVIPLLSALILPNVSNKSRIFVHEDLFEELDGWQQNVLNNILDELAGKSEVDCLLEEVSKGR